jgi:hypothetical protein
VNDLANPLQIQPAAASLPERMRRAFMNFWFGPDSPGNLGFLRICFFLLVYYLMAGATNSFVHLTQAPAEFWKPHGYFKTFNVPRPNADVIVFFTRAWEISLLTAGIGLLTRLSASVNVVAGLYIFGFRQNFGKIGHGDALLVFTALFFACSYASHALSIDQLLRWKFLRAPGGPFGLRRPRCGEYRWPVRMVWVMMAIIMFGAGYAKLYTGGWKFTWVFSDNMRNMLISHHYRGTPMVTWGLWIARYSWLCKTLAALTILVEVLMPLALINRRARIVMVSGCFLMQVGIAVLMNIKFYGFMVCYLFWVPWDRVGAMIAAPFIRRATPAPTAAPAV